MPSGRSRTAWRRPAPPDRPRAGCRGATAFPSDSERTKALSRGRLSAHDGSRAASSAHSGRACAVTSPGARDGPTVDAQGHRHVAGREHELDLRADRRVLRPAPARGQRHRGRRGRRRHSRPRPGGERPAGAQRDRARRRRTRRPASSWPGRWRPASSPPSGAAPATRRSPSGRTGRTRSPGCCAISPSCRTSRSASCSGTTKTTVNAVRDRTHWKSAEIRPRDPVLLGLCSQIDLDAAVIGARAPQPGGPVRRPNQAAEFES